MKLSKEVQEQVHRLQKTGSFALNRTQKIEVKQYTEFHHLKLLTNLDCSTCVRDSLYSIARFLKQPEKPKLVKDKMVKQHKDMTVKELKKACKDKNISIPRNATKSKLIDLLS